MCLLLGAGCLLAAGCGSDGSGPDAASDQDASADADAGEDPAMDAGLLRCDPECPGAQRCCRGPEGETTCVDTTTNPAHCGGCGVVCAEGRGTECVRGSCVCGVDTDGCFGDERSYCCPPRRDGGLRYCANLQDDGDDCGECGHSCDPAVADRCRSGNCVCGDDREGCEGTAEDTCCRTVFGDSTCVDTTASRSHCGGCQVSCQQGETCRQSVCTRGTQECSGGCASGEICCHGSCCTRAACNGDSCAGSPDAGAGDGGLRDAAPADVNTDSGMLDGAAADGS